MGCDIHCYVEKRVFAHDDKEKKNPVWVNADKWTRDLFYDREIALNPDKTQEEMEADFGRTDSSMRGWQIAYDDRIYSGRNYDLFGILANVRNGIGFAGIQTGTGFIPIAMPKGMPDDVSPQVKVCCDAWEGDGHSHSYLTLKELLDYDWENKTTTHVGYVEEAQYKLYKETGQPERWSSMLSGYMVVHLEQEEMEKLISGDMERPKVKHPETGEEKDAMCVTMVKWEVPYIWSVSEFVENTIPKLKAMCKEFVEKDENGRPLSFSFDTVDTANDIRLVFWFDN